MTIICAETGWTEQEYREQSEVLIDTILTKIILDKNYERRKITNID